MIPLLSSSATTPPPGFGFSQAARALRPTVSDMIWNLHYIIANPNSKPDEVRTARRRLLRLLKTSKFQKMIVPPLALPAEPTEGATAATKAARFHSIVRALWPPCLSRRGEGAHPSVAERTRKLLSEGPHYSFDHEAGRRAF